MDKADRTFLVQVARYLGWCSNMHLSRKPAACSMASSCPSCLHPVPGAWQERWMIDQRCLACTRRSSVSVSASEVHIRC